MRAFPLAPAAAALVLVLRAADGPAAHAAAPSITVTVFAAASLSDAFAEIGKQLERDRPGLRVRVNAAGSNQLALQIEQGAGADVFASADAAWMEEVRARGLLAGEPRDFARNRLVAIVPRTNPARIAGLRDLARRGVKLVMAAPAVPAGKYGREVLARLARAPGFGDDFARRVLANLVSEEDNVRGVVAKVQLGEADAGFCYRSDVAGSAARRVRVFEIPDSLNTLATYPIAVVAGARAREAAHAFVDRVLSPEGQAILVRHGFVPIGAP